MDKEKLLKEYSYDSNKDRKLLAGGSVRKREWDVEELSYIRSSSTPGYVTEDYKDVDNLSVSDPDVEFVVHNEYDTVHLSVEGVDECEDLANTLEKVAKSIRRAVTKYKTMVKEVDSVMGKKKSKK